MSALEVIAKHLCTMAAQGWSGISAFERAAYRTTAIGMIDTLTSSGYRILGPDELDPATVEKCAEVAETMASDWRENYFPRQASVIDDVSTAIRALCATHQGDQ